MVEEEEEIKRRRVCVCADKEEQNGAFGNQSISLGDL